ncbi:CDGSH iron-sulfur domain-containing protein [Alloacidobacterium sp.]|uniref:CDGSH iron-sulfur domain-containing protein n=1 Tax=Alloacidobacterium sp. TaxID=2951999 RepID=UPI002D3E7117|nr:CDGSH iron-sulfur domain-containing protein [Alloacidobacterium sp.]HYK35604.1 CDGSH iron-sulfur domain-containing protein [Alloacidobacterium sp.]
MSKVREYEGQGITILYDVARCFHAEECIHGAPGVFQKDARPWVSPDGENPAKTAEVIHRCPTGALHYRAKDASLNEEPDAENTVTVTANGPLLMRGDMEISLSDGLLKETRAAFCRCGASANKPFCDDSHYRIGFTDPGPAASDAANGEAANGPVTLTLAPNGPLLAKGAVIVRNGDGQTASVVTQTAFCRCGASANKPFCDGSHKRIGFTG